MSSSPSCGRYIPTNLISPRTLRCFSRAEFEPRGKWLTLDEGLKSSEDLLLRILREIPYRSKELIPSVDVAFGAINETIEDLVYLGTVFTDRDDLLDSLPVSVPGPMERELSGALLRKQREQQLPG